MKGKRGEVVNNSIDHIIIVIVFLYFFRMLLRLFGAKSQQLCRTRIDANIEMAPKGRQKLKSTVDVNKSERTSDHADKKRKSEKQHKDRSHKNRPLMMMGKQEEDTNVLSGSSNEETVTLVTSINNNNNNDSSDVEIVQAQPVIIDDGVVVQDTQKPRRASSAFQLPRNLTWEDTFYDEEDDIIAVFDIDNEGVLAYQRFQAVKFVKFALLYTLILILFSFIFSSDDDDDDDGIMAFFAFLLGACITIFLILVFIFCLKAHGAAKGGIHMAVTSNSIRYDQAANSLSKQILLNRIVTCTIAEKQIWDYMTWKECKIYIVSLQIVGAKRLVSYVGIKQAKEFQKLVVNIQGQQQQQLFQSIQASSVQHQIV